MRRVPTRHRSQAEGARGGRERETGAAIVEFAIVLPILAILLAGGLDMGLLTMDHQILQNAAREGARYAAMPGSYIPDDPTALARIRQRVRDYLDGEGITVADGDITVVQGSPGCEVTYPDGTTVGCSEVRVVFSRQLYFPGLTLLGVNPVDIEGVAVFRNLYGN